MAREEAEIKELSKKLAQQPDSMVFVQLADAYRRSGDLEQSIQVCLQGLDKHPTYTTARAILGRNFLDLGRLDEAASEFRQIEVADPENVMAHRMLGQIFLQKGQYAEAISRQQRVLALDPDDSTAQELLQEALKQAKQHEGAPKAAPTPAVTASAATSEQQQTLKVADIYIKKGALDEAAEVLQELLTADPNNALARQKLQELDQRRGKQGGAGEQAQAAEAAQKKAEDEARQKAENEARQKAEAEAKRQAVEAAQKKAEDEARQKAEAEAKRQAEEDAERQAAKLSSDDILAVMTRSSDDLISDEPTAKPDKAAAVAPAAGLDPAVKLGLDEFIRAQGIEASLLLGAGGKLLDARGGGDSAALGTAAAAVFHNTEKAAQRMSFGGLKQIMIVGEDGRQILFVALKVGVLVALTGKNTNLGLLRVAIHDLVKRA